ncbi:MAG: hypothetical protein AB7O88_03145 [Reyranellaceae bacterium]
MIRQIAVAVLSAGALAACVPYGAYGDGMTPYSSGYANPMAQAITQMTTGGYGYGQPTYGYGNPYYGAAPAPVYAPPPVYMPQQAAAPVYAPSGYPYSYGGNRPRWQGRPHHAAADRNNNGVPDWKERDRNSDGTPDYQQHTRRFPR